MSARQNARRPMITYRPHPVAQSLYSTDGLDDDVVLRADVATPRAKQPRMVVCSQDLDGRAVIQTIRASNERLTALVERIAGFLTVPSLGEIPRS